MTYRTYWITWGVLLALSVLMIALDTSGGGGAVVVMMLLVAMLVKAGFIGGTFMHLRNEPRALVLTVIFGMLVTGAVLILLLAADALSIAGAARR